MAYAVIEAGGKQFRVSPGEVVQVPVLNAEVGAAVEFAVLARGDGDRVEVGTPTLEGSVQAVVVEHDRGPKIIVFKKKRRKQYKKTHGHRQDFTAVRIESLGGK